MNEREEMFDRALPLFGEDGLERIKHARVALFGVGGVGGACAEALVRGGVKRLTITDGDVFTPSNLNRQRFAYADVLGQPKAEVAARELERIAPDAEVTAICEYYKEDAAFDFSAYDFVADAIDDLPAKISVIERATRLSVPVVSACGAGNKLDPTRFRVADVYSTAVCPLARALRKLCRERGIASLPVVYSDEPPAVRTPSPASSSFVPPAAGLALASYVLLRLAGKIGAPNK